MRWGNLLKVNDKVLVIEKEAMMGMASVIDVCETTKQLYKYFKSNHPRYGSYLLAVENDELVYIVNFENDMGQAGFLKKQLRKMKNKNTG